MRTKVILTGSVENLGDQGDQVQVAAGFARNFLFPKGLAILATAGNLRRVETFKKRRETELVAKLDEAKVVAAKLAALSLTIGAPVGTDGKLFGSVTTSDIAARLAAQGLEIDRKKLALEHPIRELGKFEVQVKLHPQLSVPLTVTVIASSAADAAAAAATATPRERPARRRSPKKEQPKS